MQAIITSVGHFVPDHKLTNRDLEKMVNTSDQWITSRTGIRERRILEKGKATSDMAVKAAEMALRQRNIPADDIELIIMATVTPDTTVPTTAAIVQKKLGASKCWGFDLNGGCAGFICALATASQFIETGKHKKILVIGADTMSTIINYQDRNTCVIFGDAAGAVLLEPSPDEELGIRDFTIHLDGIGEKYLNVPAGGSRRPASKETVEKNQHFVFQDGKAVFKYAVSGITDVSKKILKKNNLDKKELKFLIPHQANLRIIDAVAKKLKLDHKQVVVNLNKYGNTTSATIPLAMSEIFQQGLLGKGDQILLSAFGAGFTWGSLLLKWAVNYENTTC